MIGLRLVVRIYPKWPPELASCLIHFFFTFCIRNTRIFSPFISFLSFVLLTVAYIRDITEYTFPSIKSSWNRTEWDRTDKKKNNIHWWRHICERSAHVSIVINVRFTTNNVPYPLSLIFYSVVVVALFLWFFVGVYACKTSNSSIVFSIFFFFILSLVRCYNIYLVFLLLFLLCILFFLFFDSVLSPSINVFFFFFIIRFSLHLLTDLSELVEQYEHVRFNERLLIYSNLTIFFSLYSSCITSFFFLLCFSELLLIEIDERVQKIKKPKN